MTKLYLEDICAGQKFGSGEFSLSAESIKEFAALWDPQVFHLDEVGAKDTFFQGLAASGWQTACITMRLFVTGELQPANGFIGAGIDELRWFRPVRPEDVLHLQSEVLESRPMRSKPGYGIVKVKVLTLDAANQPVQHFVTSMVVEARDKG
ncbi:MAG: MaoC family dehydratase [Magnetospirillum gryphiswaldense]|nr:MaoC family dehydratase [Magnetospirillum gryphiswaldense]